jgi:hypothetical protein
MGDRRVCVPRNAESQIIGPANVPDTQERADRSDASVTASGASCLINSTSQIDPKRKWRITETDVQPLSSFRTTRWSHPENTYEFDQHIAWLASGAEPLDAAIDESTQRSTVK